jgi:hypothetical protein
VLHVHDHPKCAGLGEPPGAVFDLMSAARMTLPHARAGCRIQLDTLARKNRSSTSTIASTSASAIAALVLVRALLLVIVHK